jgi:alpha-L-rhamnosidase
MRRFPETYITGKHATRRIGPRPLLLLAATVLACSGCSTLPNGGLAAEQLSCEYRTNPLGIDVLQPRLSWILKSNRRAQVQNAYQVIVAQSAETLENNQGDLWDTGRIDSSQSIHVVYQGRPLSSEMRCYWKVRVWNKAGRVSSWSQPAWWETALLEPRDWKAVWINDGKATPQNDEGFYKDDPAPLFRKEFSVAKSVKRARLYVSGLGYYEARLNGRRVGDHILDPGWTTYSKRVLYSTYDVTSMLRKGRNVVGVMLGNGWYNPLPLRMWGRLNLREHLTVGRPRLLAQLHIEYTDGTSQLTATDTSWKVAEGPVIRNSVYLGELYDARRERPGWDSPGFDDRSWRYARGASEPLGALCAQSAPPVRVTRAIRPVSVTKAAGDLFIFDMGQNFTGLVRLRVRGPAGTIVTMRYGELLNKDGTLNVMTSTCGQIKRAGAGGPGAPPVAYQSDTYILKGAGLEVYTPRFTFHGFRYVEVAGYPATPGLDAVEGLRLNADVEQVGSFSCSNQMFNRIQEMVRWSFLSNLLSVQMDCPHREKFGYGGDAFATAQAHCFNFDMACFYAKMTNDFGDAARPNGGLTETAPYVGIADRGFGGGSGPVGWVVCHPHLQQELYRFYGDRRLVEQQYENSRRSLEFMRSATPDNIISVGISDHESIDPKPTALTGTAFYYDHAVMLSRLARIIGRDPDADRYDALAEKIKQAFIDRFLEPGTGRFDSHTQACQAFALYYDLVPENERRAAIDVLLDEIRIRHKGHLSTGIFGTRFMLDVLSRIGSADVACAVVNRRTFPGWGHMLENGATTMWEHWAFSDNTFSHNHSMFGSVSEWFFKSAVGIRPGAESVGFDRIIIRPELVGELTWASGTYKSIRGGIVSDWRLEGDTLRLRIAIPPNTTATVYVPAADEKNVTEGGRPAAGAEGVEFLRMEQGRAVYAVGSGDYSFVSKGINTASSGR